MNASDEINALLNYGYAILKSLARKMINTVGPDSSVGFLHELAPSKTPLVYVLQELYRWLIDLSVIELLEEKKLKKSDFIVTENYHIRLRENTAKMLIEKIQLNFNSRTGYKKKNHTYELIYLDNMQMLANYIADKANDLKICVPSKSLSRNDNKYLRDLLANMTQEQRRELGINKSTLWYIQQNIKKGKKIEVYDKVMAKIS